jgi:hypothetical protein
MQSTTDTGVSSCVKPLRPCLWSETNMQVLRQLLDCSASTARRV